MDFKKKRKKGKRKKGKREKKERERKKKKKRKQQFFFCKETSQNDINCFIY